MTLRLRPYNTSDEAPAIAIHEEMLAEDSHFLRFWQPSMPWPEFLQSNDELRQGLDPSIYRVRGCQLAAVVDGVIVGRTSLRYELNEFFAERGGHVGTPWRRRIEERATPQRYCVSRSLSCVPKASNAFS
jgi:predicted acetyltransferase